MPHDTGRLSRLSEEVVVLAQTAELLNSLDLDEVLTRTLALLTRTVNAERGSFFVFSADGRAAERFIITRDLPPARSRTVVEQVLQDGLAGWVYRHKQGALVGDTRHDNRWVTLPDNPDAARSVLCVPFIRDGHIHGIMTLEHRQPDQFTPADVRLATTVANQAAVSLRNAQLFAQVETQERQISAVLQSTLQPILTISPAGVIRLANQAAGQMIGLPLDSIIGQPLAELSANPLLPEVAAQIAAGHARMELRDEDAGRDYLVQVSSWREGDAHELGRVIVFNDITALKDVSRLKTQMLELTSHDLNNPLSIVNGYAELMLNEMDPAHPHYEYVADIARVAQRMQVLISQLLDLERIEAASRGGGVPFDPLPLIEEVRSDLEPAVALKRQTLITDLPPGPGPRLVGYATQVREAFKNLVENASKYTPEGGRITVRAAVDTAHRRFEFVVEDNGYGIPEALQPHLFERFYRARQPGAERITGTGLGLSLVKAVVERHGGEVWFHSAAGQGSTFGLWLPIPGEDDLPPG